MRYAIAAENGEIAGHFGHAPSFIVVEIDQICGVSGTIDDIIASLAAGTLAEGEIVCDHGHH